MDLPDLDFSYPESAVATAPRRPTRVAWSALGQPARAMDLDELARQFSPGDLLVINDTRVIPARIITASGVEILFVRALDRRAWEVLMPARGLSVGQSLDLPGGAVAMLTAKGLPQSVTVDRDLDAVYFATHGQFALPPYIQKARGETRHRAEDEHWYQTAWANHPGSIAAPTASLHFTARHLDAIRARGAEVATLTLHVGPGTFLPIRGPTLVDHVMHAETVAIPRAVVGLLDATKRRGGRTWALGTTVTRALESLALGLLAENADGFGGETRLFIHSDFEFQTVDVLLTNFHQPRSTLLALVGAFAGMDRVRRTYAWAIANDFKLFSYGDLSAWTRR